LICQAEGALEQKGGIHAWGEVWSAEVDAAYPLRFPARIDPSGSSPGIAVRDRRSVFSPVRPGAIPSEVRAETLRSSGIARLAGRAKDGWIDRNSTSRPGGLCLLRRFSQRSCEHPLDLPSKSLRGNDRTV